ncbi:hypothetical protein FQR65_LT18900 [Abscondita terminalis]|nr:hypothetical protein FQR65_LT18900 [Abscondita terminalis]
MSKQLNLWKQENGEEKLKNFLTSLGEGDFQKHATTIYRHYEQSHNQKHFRENKFASGAVVIASCALILLSRYFDLREKVQRPLEYMALASIVIFGVGFLYSLYQENEYKVSDKREKYESDYEKHQMLPEENGEEKLKNFLTSLGEGDFQKHATTIYRHYEQSHNQKHFRENKFASGAVVIASCALILLSRYFDLREKVQRPLEYMALASIVIFGVGFLYSLYQENEYKVSDKRENYESDYEKHQMLPEVKTITDELKAELLGENKQRS